MHRAQVVRVVPDGPYAEVVAHLAGYRLSAFRSGSLPAEGAQKRVRLRRPMVFVDGVREDAGSPVAGARG